MSMSSVQSTVIRGVLSLLVFASTAYQSQAQTCVNVLGQLQGKAQMHAHDFLQEVAARSSIISEDLQAIYEGADSHVLVGLLDELRIATKALREIDHEDYADDIESQMQVANYVMQLAAFLDFINVPHSIQLKADSFVPVLILHGDDQGNRLARLIARMQKVNEVDVIYDPHTLISRGAAGMYDDSNGLYYISTNFFMSVSEEGKIINFLRPGGTEWHEFTHLRYAARRTSGEDHLFSTIIIPKEGYRSMSIYNRGFYSEEIPVYLNEMQVVRRHYVKLLENFDNLDWGRATQRLGGTLAMPMYYFEKVVGPMAYNTQHMGLRNLELTKKMQLIAHKADESEFLFHFDGLDPEKYLAVLQLDETKTYYEFIIQTPQEISVTPIHNPEMITKFLEEHENLDRYMEVIGPYMQNHFELIADQSFEVRKILSKFVKLQKVIVKELKANRSNKGKIEAALLELKDLMFDMHALQDLL